MKNTKTILIAVFFITLIAFLSFYTEKGAPENHFFGMPNILLAHNLGIERMDYNEETEKYEIKKSYNSTEKPLQLGVTDKFVFFATKNSIIRLNDDLEKDKELAIKELGEIKTTKRNIFVSTKDGIFASFNENLNKLSSVRLNYKYAHDFIIHEEVAYLLDNIMFPIYIFKVDVKNPNNIKITKRVEISGINHHLSAHWLNPDLDRWMVVQSQSTSGGGLISVIFYSMSTVRRINIEKIFSNTFDNNWEPEGYNIITTTELPPIWSVRVKDSDYYLAYISTEGDVISKTIYLDLGEYEHASSDFIIKKHGNYLFLAYKKKLQVFDISDEPELVLSRSVNYNINDFAFSR